LKVGDVLIVPPGVIHGWADIPDHVDYLRAHETGMRSARRRRSAQALSFWRPFTNPACA
jgi:hypothetical protein